MKELYDYSCIKILQALICSTTIIAVSTLLEKVVPTMIFLFFFYTLRRRTGGFHCKSFGRCYFMSILLYIGVVKLEPYISGTTWFIYIIVLSSIIIFTIGTVNHPNLDYDETELKRSKLYARRILIVELLIVLILAKIKIEKTYVYYMSISIVMCAVLLLLAKFYRQEKSK